MYGTGTSATLAYHLKVSLFSKKIIHATKKPNKIIEYGTVPVPTGTWYHVFKRKLAKYV